MSTDNRNLALLAHLSALVAFIGVPSFVGPLVVWLWQRDSDSFVAEHAREALNFNLSVLIYGIAAAILAVLLTIATLGIGVLILAPLALIVGIVFVALVVMAAVRAANGEAYRYPFTIRFVR